MNQEDKIRKAMIALRQSYELLATMLPPERGAQIGVSLDSEETVIKIKQAVTKVFGVDPNKKSQRDGNVLARHAYRFLLRYITNKTYKAIGLLTGSYDHQTIINSVKVCKQMMKQYKWYESNIEQCKVLLAAEIAEVNRLKPI
jgi:chromosomal replication initiation ATPase DnaA